MENNYAEVPTSKPNNAAIYQLPAVSLGGQKFYGWEMVYFKSVDTGKKDKHGKEIIKSVPDKARPVTYDVRTQQLMVNKQNSNAISNLLLNNAKSLLQNKQQASINSQTLLKLANQVVQNQKQNKVNSQLLMQIAKLEIQVKGDK